MLGSSVTQPALFSLLPLPLALFREDSSLEQANPAFTRVPADALRTAVARVLADGAPTTSIVEAPASDGAPRRVYAFSLVALRGDEGGIEGVLAAGSDITEERARAAQLREMLMGMVGHDLRNPLAALTTGAALLLRRAGLPPAQEATARRMQSSANRMARMIAHIVEYIRTVFGEGIPVDRKPVDMVALVHAVALEMEAAFPGRSVAIDAAATVPGAWDAALLEILVENLLRNALQHGAKDGLVRIEVRPKEDAVELIVANEGEPITDETRALVFEPYAFRTRLKKSGSLGLGLYVSRCIAVAHGGELDLVSTREDGTRVRAVFPRDARGASGET